MEERLQKYMARCGVDSRRKCEELIAGGLVEVNGEIIREPGVKIVPGRDRIRVDGKPLRAESPAYYAHYKVKGVTTTVSDDLGRKTVMDCLPDIRERIYPVGRLDKESEGLLILTNDGELANYLTHPAHGIEKTYRVVAEGRVSEDVLRALGEKGIRLGPVLIRPSQVKLVRYDNDNTVVLISVSEGINREVRRIFAALGHEVKKLLRTRVGPIELEGMKRGTTRPLTKREIVVLRKGMEGLDAGAEAKLFPAGSAAGRKPKGPRGRPRGTAAPRRGKPDPAKAERRGPGGGAAKPRAVPGRKGRGGVVVDDWEKAAGSKRRGGAKAAEAAPVKALRPERPGRAPGGRSGGKPVASVAAAKPLKPAANTEKPAKTVAHPLMPKPMPKATGRPAAKPTTKRPAGKSGARPAGKPTAKRPAAKPTAKRPAAKPTAKRPAGRGKKGSKR